MSFKPNGKDILNFEDTYYSDEDDALNDATFGADIPVGQDFNFGGSSTTSSDAPQQTLNYAQIARSAPQAAPAVEQQFNPDDALKPMESLWGGSDNNSSQPNPNAFSLEQLEAQMAQKQQQQQQQQLQQPQFNPQMFPNQPMMPNGNFFYPPAPNPQQQFNLAQIPPQQFAQLPPQVQQQLLQQQFNPQFNPQFQNFPPPPQLQQQQIPPQMPAQIPTPPPESQESPALKEVQPVEPAHQHPQKAPDLSQFPVLGSEEANNLRDKHVDQVEAQAAHQNQHQQQQQHYQSPSQNNQNQYHNNRNHNNNNNNNNRKNRHNHINLNELSPEEREKYLRRQHKINRIMENSGFMSPRDKDFVTRVHLSKIVSDDPYAEDFYYQVFKVLKTGQEVSNFNSIAQSYLDFSGHRLGGREKRADVALQRMQQQVQKAVSVVKERSKLTPNNKKATLGRLATLSRNNKNVRNFKLELPEGPELPEISQSGRQFVLLLIESIYDEVLNLESLERQKKPIDNERLWNSLKLFDENHSLNPFIQVLSHEKGLKVFPRIFHFLNREQKLTVITLLFANLSLIKIISKSSFKSYPNDEIPADISKTIELFRVVVLKPIVLFLSYEAVLNEIIGLLTILVQRNNVAFLSTSQLGVSLITILLSRAELIKQEQAISGEELQHWSDAYDELFSSLETKLSLIFPQNRKTDDSYIWQFLASLALSGKINHQRIIVDESRDAIFGSIKKAKESDEPTKIKILSNLNLLLNVMGLYANEDEIMEMKSNY